MKFSVYISNRVRLLQKTPLTCLVHAMVNMAFDWLSNSSSASKLV